MPAEAETCAFATSLFLAIRQRPSDPHRQSGPPGARGYHVTPLRLAGSEMRVLVNRGWVPAGADHRQFRWPTFRPGPVESRGSPSFPGNRFFTLARKRTQPGNRLAKPRPRPFPPRGCPSAAADHSPACPAPGGFVRDWPRPDERADKAPQLRPAVVWLRGHAP